MVKHLTNGLRLGRSFLRWWLAELAFVVPPSVRRWITCSDIVAITLGSDQGTVTHEIPGKARVLGHLPIAAPDGPVRFQELLDSVPNLRRRIARGRAIVALRLPPEQALRTPIKLPLIAEANLRQALIFQLDRRTPFPPGAVYFGYRVLGRDEVARHIDVELAVVPRTVVCAAMSAGRALGLEPSMVEIAAATPQDRSYGNLLPDEERRPRRGRATFVARVAMAGLALAALAAAYQPIREVRRTAEALEIQVQAEKQSAGRARKLGEDVAKLTEAEEFLIGGKKGRLTTIEVLYELTRVLPDDTWLRDLHIGTSEIRIGGYSKSASNLIKLLQQSGVFIDPQFRAPVTQDPVSGKERFELTASVAKRATS